MNVFELAQYANESINGGDESKYPVTLAVISAMIKYFRITITPDLIDSEEHHVRREIERAVENFYNESDIEMLKNVHSHYFGSGIEFSFESRPHRRMSLVEMVLLLVRIIMQNLLNRIYYYLYPR